jgi:hypothetical protein
MDADELAQPIGHDLDVGVAGQVAGDGVGHDRAHLELRGTEPAVGAEVDVHDDMVAVAALAGACQGGVEGVGGLGGHAHQPVGPTHASRPVERHLGGGVEVVAVAELGVASCGQPEPHQRTLIRREAELAPQPTVAVVTHAQHTFGLGPRGGAVGLFG